MSSTPAAPIEAVVFDFGGVFTTSPFEALARMGADAGIEAERAIELVFGSYDDDTDHPWHRAERGELDLDTARREIRERSRTAGSELDLYDILRYLAEDGGGVREVVVEHVRMVRRAGLRTGLLTNNVAEFREFWRPLLPLDELFDDVVDSSEVGFRKPDDRIYALSLSRLGVEQPSRAVFLDDWPGNVAAARQVGMHGIVVPTDPRPALDELLAIVGLSVTGR